MGTESIFSAKTRPTIHIKGGSVMKIIGRGILLLLLVSASIASADVIYKWVDKDGSVNFTDDLNQVPPEYRNQIQKEQTIDIEKPQIRSPAPAPIQKGGEDKRDAHGRGEEYWRERVRPWKEQLKQAQEGYENRDMKIKAVLEELKGRYYSHTQYNIKRVEAEQLATERGAYEAKMKEANEKLAKIAKEAEEAKANPAWLK
jgi:hypothetical protein